MARMSWRDVRYVASIGLAFLGASVVAANTLGPLAASMLLTGGMVGVLATRISDAAGLRSHVRRLEDATSHVIDSGGRQVLEPPTFGPLAPVARSVVELQRTLERAVEEATTDRLTQVANRPMLLAMVFDEVERASRYGRPLSLAFIDLDHFKSINDSHGHNVGDAVLQSVAGVLSANLRQSDRIGRYGGEEFVIVFPETTVDEATTVVEKLRLLVSKHRVDVAGAEPLTVTVSVGLAGGHGQPLRVDDLLRDADAAMYAAKSLGRNQTYVFAEVDDDSARIPRAPMSPAARSAAAEVGERVRHAAEAALASVIMPLPHHRGKPSSLIATIAVRLARGLDLPIAEIERIRVASLLHDIGKVGVPGEILEKPGPLSSDEWQTVVQHPRIGQEIINRVAAVKDAGAIILHHHERFSGHGYPHGLRGADIPLGARVVAIADAYDAMVRDRPYRSAIGHEAAIAEIRSEAGTHFDPELVELFCSMFADEEPQADPSLLITPQTPENHHPLSPIVEHRNSGRSVSSS